MRSSLAGGLVLAFAFPALLWAQPERVGSEFQVNQHTTFSQRYPEIAGDGTGRFVVVWHSFGQDPGVLGSYGVFGRLFDSSGAPSGGEFQLHTHTTDRQDEPSVAMSSSGDFVAVWSSLNQDGYGAGVFGQRFDSSGGPIGSEFLVNEWTTGNQTDPSIAMDGQGNFVIVWWGDSLNDSEGIVGQRFDSLANPVGGDFQVNVHINNRQNLPELSANAAGDFAVAWQSWEQDGSEYATFMRWFDTAGTAPVGGFQVNENTAGTQWHPKVAMADDGTFAVVWSDQGAPETIFLQRYDSSGLPIGANFEVASHPTSVDDPDIAMDADGRFVVVWEEWGDGSYTGVRGLFFDRTGLPLGRDFQVNTWTTDRQRTPSVAMDEDGDFVVVWTSSGQAHHSYGSYGQRFEAPSFEIIDPLDGGSLDCTDPRVIRPTISWDPARFDRFRVFLAADLSFAKGVKVSSGEPLLRDPFWTPSRKKWRRACAKATAANPSSPILYIRVLGKDRDLPKTDPARKGYTPTIVAEIQT